MSVLTGASFICIPEPRQVHANYLGHTVFILFNSPVFFFIILSSISEDYIRMRLMILNLLLYNL